MLGHPAGGCAVPAGLAGAAQREVDGAVAEEPAAAGEVAAGVLGAGPGNTGGGVTIFAVVVHGASPSGAGGRPGAPKSSSPSVWPRRKASRCRSAPPSILVARRGLNGGWSWDPATGPAQRAGLVGGLDSSANAGRALLLANPPQTAHRSYPRGPKRRTFWATRGVGRLRTSPPRAGRRRDEFWPLGSGLQRPVLAIVAWP